MTTEAPEARIALPGPARFAPPEPVVEPVEEGRTPGRTALVDHRYRLLLAFADVAACAVAVAACLLLLGSVQRASVGVVAAMPLVVALSKLLGLYDRDELVLRKSTLEEAPRLFQLATVFSLVLWIASEPLDIGRLAGGQVAALWASMFLLLVGTRLTARAVARATTPPERCLLLGDTEACRRVAKKLRNASTVNAEVVAQITSPQIGQAEVPLAMLTEVAARHEIQRVIIAPRSTDHGDVLDLVRGAKSLGLKVSVLPRVLEIVGSSVVIDDVDGLRVLGVARFGLTRSSMLVKRGLDVAGAGLGLILIAPLLAVIAVAIKLTSPGPVLFRQQRVGRDGESFTMFKFRTMCDDAEQRKDELRALNEADGLFKIADDPRITPVGRVLRRVSLDELPQLFNVVRGEMSLVGPRPLVDEDDARIEGYDRHRLHLTPGMTGPWQVVGPGRLPLNEMVKLDYLYVSTWSLWNDVKILLRTVSFVLARHGL